MNTRAAWRLLVAVALRLPGGPRIRLERRRSDARGSPTRWLAFALVPALAGCPALLSDWTVAGRSSDGGGGDATMQDAATGGDRRTEGGGGDGPLTDAVDGAPDTLAVDSGSVDAVVDVVDTSPPSDNTPPVCSVAAGTCTATGGTGDCSNSAFAPYYCPACAPDACPMQLPNVYCCATVP
jgi:hypothetical protein